MKGSNHESGPHGALNDKGAQPPPITEFMLPEKPEKATFFIELDFGDIAITTRNSRAGLEIDRVKIDTHGDFVFDPPKYFSIEFITKCGELQLFLDAAQLNAFRDILRRLASMKVLP